MNLQDYIKTAENFPKEGILFRDISPLLADAAALDEAAKQLTAMIDLEKTTAFAGIEARGFILAAYMAGKYQKGFIPLRKAGKLPPPTLLESYNLEYGSAALEIPLNKSLTAKTKIVLVDDVIATGGTLQAALNLCQQAGYEVIDVLALINLTKLNNFKFNGQTVKSLLQY